MTHDTPPKRIWAWYLHPEMRNDVMEGGWTESPDKREAEYILASEADAMVAVALREAARTGDRFIIPSLTPIMQISETQLGRDAAAQEMQQRILALIPAPASAALDKLIAEAVKAERERCAKLAENIDYPWEQGQHLTVAEAADATARSIAAAIRAKGDQT